MAKQRLIDKARALQPYKRPTWFDKQTPASQKELLELREDWQKGKLPNANKTALADMVIENGIQVSPFAFVRWLDEKTDAR